MSGRRIGVTTSRKASGEIAEVFTSAVAGWLHLDRLGVVQQVRQRLRLERKAGCCGQELFGLLFLMVMAGVQGQRALQRAAQHCKKALADVLGVRTFRSQASMSRALKSLSAERSREFCDWLLGDALDVEEFERDHSTFHLDTFGERWRMVDFDGRVHAIRNRALPRDEDSPEPVRRSSELARPGYPGRKRGEVQYHRMAVQDAGTSRYLGVRLGPGNGDHRADVEWAVERIAAWADRFGIERKRVCARFDGKAVGAPILIECARAGISFVTRWIEYSLLEQAEVQVLLERGPWHPVSDSGSGPRREALELGIRKFAWSSGSQDGDGKENMLQARVVVSRYRLDRKHKKGCGKQIGDFVYELYVTSLPSSSWPAAELVEAYYGRVTQENRFGQTDLEQGCQKIVSWNIPGQELANAVSLFAWNLRLLWGADLAGWIPTPHPELQPTQPVVAAADNVGRQEDTTIAGDMDALHDHDEPPLSPPDDQQTPVAETTPVPMESTDASVSEPGSGENVAAAAKTAKWYIARGLVTAAFVAALRWPTLLERFPGWRWNSELQELHCPAGEPMRWRGARQQARQSLSLRFRVRRPTACRHCSQRSKCTKSSNPSFVKDLNFTISALELSSFLEQNPLSATQPTSPCFVLHDEPLKSHGPWAAQAPMLVPSVFRRQLALILGGCRVRVESPKPSLITALPSWLARDADDRQHRRASYAARESRCLLPDDHPLHIHIHKPPGRTAASLRKLIPPAPTRGNNSQSE